MFHLQLKEPHPFPIPTLHQPPAPPLGDTSYMRLRIKSHSLLILFLATEYFSCIAAENSALSIDAANNWSARELIGNHDSPRWGGAWGGGEGGGNGIG